HNKIINTQLEIYRVRPGAYGCQSAEIYDNAFSAEGAKMGRPQGFIFISGGVAMVFNNTVSGTTYNCRTIELSHERSFRPICEYGLCDGTNPIDGNQIPAGQRGAGYPCFGQPGRATDADGDGVFEPSPCYAWSNTLNGAKLNFILRRWNPKETELQGEHAKAGRGRGDPGEDREIAIDRSLPSLQNRVNRQSKIVNLTDSICPTVSSIL